MLIFIKFIFVEKLKLNRNDLIISMASYRLILTSINLNYRLDPEPYPNVLEVLSKEEPEPAHDPVRHVTFA